MQLSWYVKMQLYTIITLALDLQTIYYGHIYPQLKYRRQLKVPVPMLYFTNHHCLFKIRILIKYAHTQHFEGTHDAYVHKC